MQVHTERRTPGTDRRQFNLPSEAILGLSNEIAFGASTHDGNGTYDPNDPYWEPVNGQDDA
jgi:hypothetical protein